MTPSPMVRVVDDDESFRTAVSRFLRASGYSVRAYGSAAEFLADSTWQLPGCILLDLEMPELDGLAVQEALKTAQCPLPIVFLSGRGDIPRSVMAMRRGAEDFLTKECADESLLEAIQRAVVRDAEDRGTRARLAELRSRLARLSEREQQVLREVVRGKLNKQIAADLGIHERTVKLHRTNLTTKLGIQSVAELTRLVQEAGWTGPAPVAFPKGQ